jgi:hypothetical protein
MTRNQLRDSATLVITLLFMLLADACGAAIFVPVMLYLDNAWFAPLAFILAGAIGGPFAFFVLGPPYLWIIDRLETPQRHG